MGGLGYGYDANGFLVRTSDAGELTPSEQQHRFVNDAQGNVLYAYYTSSSDPSTQYNGQRQVVVNGEVLGRYGQTMDERFPQGNPFMPGSEAWKPEVAFSFGYQPIDGNYPAGSPGVYAVQTNDTLQSIAKGAYGDGNLWYLIADANGLMSNADLRAGQVLTIPSRVTSANNVNTFKPYDPSKIANDTPTMMARPQDEGGGCGAVGQVIVAVIAVVVAVYTGGVGGAMLGSVVGQAAGVAMGVQDNISLKQVALAGISAGVNMGVGELIGPSIQSVTNSAVATRFVIAALSNAATQGIAVATGLQEKFSWRSVAASAVGTGIGQALSGPLNSAFGTTDLGQFATRAVSGFAAGMATAALRGGRIGATQVAIDAFGNALGDSIAAANGQSSGRGSGTAGSPYVDPDTGDHIVFNNTPPSNDFSRVNAVMADAPDFGDGDALYVDRSNDVLLADASRYTGDRLSISLTPSERAADERLASGRQTADGQKRLDELQRNLNDLLRLREEVDSRKASGGLTGTSNVRQADSAAYRREAAQLASDLYASGAADIRMTETPASSRPYEPFESDYPVTEQPSTPVNTAEVAGPSFQAQNDQKVIVGSYNRWSEMGSALSDGRYGDAWSHFNFTASDQGRAAVQARLAPDPRFRQLDGMLASPLGAIAVGATTLLGGDARAQQAALGLGTAADGLLVARAGLAGRVTAYSGAQTTVAPDNVIVYRAEGKTPGARSQRVFIDAENNVTIPEALTQKGRGAERNLYVGFDAARATEFMQQRINRTGDGTVRSFEVPRSFLNELRKTAVPEDLRGQYPDRPVIADPTKAPDQYGLGPKQIEQIRSMIIPASGKTIY